MTKPPTKTVTSHVAYLAKRPDVLYGRHLDILSYKRGISELADLVLNIPSEIRTWNDFAEVIALTWYRWREENIDEKREKPDYSMWVRKVLRRDLAKKLYQLTNEE